MFFVPLVEDAVDSEVDFPKNTFDEGGDDGDDDDVHEAEEDHDEGVELGVPPAVVVGDDRPPCLNQNLHHEELSTDEIPEGGELVIAIVVGGTCRLV